jgi:hypothetical protein
MRIALLLQTTLRRHANPYAPEENRFPRPSSGRKSVSSFPRITSNYVIRHADPDTRRRTCILQIVRSSPEAQSDSGRDNASHWTASLWREPFHSLFGDATRRLETYPAHLKKVMQAAVKPQSETIEHEPRILLHKPSARRNIRYCQSPFRYSAPPRADSRRGLDLPVASAML